MICLISCCISQAIPRAIDFFLPLYLYLLVLLVYESTDFVHPFSHMVLIAYFFSLSFQVSGNKVAMRFHLLTSLWDPLLLLCH